MDGSRSRNRSSPIVVARTGSSRNRNSQASPRSASRGAGDGGAARIRAAARAGITITSGWLGSAEDALQHEQDVGGALGQPAHVPGEPVRAIADQDAHLVAGAPEPLLLPA